MKLFYHVCKHSEPFAILFGTQLNANDSQSEVIKAGPSSRRDIDLLPAFETETTVTYHVPLKQWEWQTKKKHLETPDTLEVTFNKLNDTNYEEWSTNMEAVFILSGSWPSLDKHWLKKREGDTDRTTENRITRQKARLSWAYIYLTCGPNVQKHIRGIRDGATAYRVIRDRYAPRDENGNIIDTSTDDNEESFTQKQVETRRTVEAETDQPTQCTVLADHPWVPPTDEETAAAPSKAGRGVTKTRGTRRVFKRGKK